MDKEKKESAMRTAESFVKKTEIEKAFILGYMFKKIQLKELDQCDQPINEPELVGK